MKNNRVTHSMAVSNFFKNHAEGLVYRSLSDFVYAEEKDNQAAACCRSSGLYMRGANLRCGIMSAPLLSSGNWDEQKKRNEVEKFKAMLLDIM